MKYILKNIKNFVKHETLVFILTIACICSASLIAVFSFGFYHHIEQKKDDELNGVLMFGIEFHDETRTNVTKGSMMEVIMGLDSRVLEGCIIYPEGRFLEDKTDDPVIDNSVLPVDLAFSVSDGRVTAAPLGEKLLESGLLKDGDYFSAEQVENGEYVCIGSFLEPENWHDPEQRKWAYKYAPDENGNYTVDGKTYKCIGHADNWTVTPKIPVTTVDDDCYIQRISFEFENPVTRYIYNEISSAFKERYGSMAEVEQLSIKDIDSQKFYSLLIALTAAIGLLAGIVAALLYEYIIIKRRKTLTVFRLCGLSLKKAVSMYFTECVSISAASYVFSVLLYHNLMLPYLSKSFEYMGQSYSLKVYFTIGIIYISIILAMLFLMIYRSTKNEIAGELRGE